jgi:hypothetical protein
MVVKWNLSVLTMNPNSHRLLFILNRYLVMRGEFDTHTHHPLFFCGKLCENIRPAPIGRQPSVVRDEGLSGSHYQLAGPINANFEVWFLLLDNEPISGSHFSSFLHILPLKLYNG